MITTPAQAFAAQTAMFDWFNTPDAFKARLEFLRLYVSNVAELKAGRVVGLDEEPPTEGEIRAGLGHFQGEARMIRDGTPVFVTSEAMDLVDEAVEEMPSEVMLYQDLPMDSFVLWFERPLVYHPVMVGPEGEQFIEPWNLDAVGIRFAPQEILVKSEVPEDIWKERGWAIPAEDVEDKEAWLRDGVLMYCYVSHRHIPTDMEGGTWADIPRERFGPYGLIDFVGVGFDVDWASRDIDTPARKLHKWLIALMRLMGEHIELVGSGVPRAMLRAGVRAGRTIPRDGYLSILHLRSIAYAMKEAGESDEAHHLRWKHRVRGHWQRFYMPTRGYPVGHPKAYRHRYVNSYVRGPGDVVESHRVVVVDR